MKILLLAAGLPDRSVGDDYPLWLNEFDGKPLIERHIERCLALTNIELTVALRSEDVEKYHLDDVIQLLSENVRLLKVPRQTKGALCTALLAVDFVGSTEDLLILNGDEMIDVDILDLVRGFKARNLDAATLTFASVHPRYSYVRLDADGFVTEVAEKRPISKNATVGFYWFSSGSDFVAAAMAELRDGSGTDGQYYVSTCLNQLILAGKRVGAHAVDGSRYHPLKTDRQIVTYENEFERPVA